MSPAVNWFWGSCGNVLSTLSRSHLSITFMEHLLRPPLVQFQKSASSHKMLFFQNKFLPHAVNLTIMYDFQLPESLHSPRSFGQLTNIYWVTPAQLTLCQGIGISFKSIHLTFKEFGETKSKLEQDGTAETLLCFASLGTDGKERSECGGGVDSLLAGPVGWI